jgi:hypothetical protein
MSDPVWVEAGIEVLAEACPEEPPRTWELLRTALDEGFRSIDDRLQNLGPLQPDRFKNEANTWLTELTQVWRWRS